VPVNGFTVAVVIIGGAAVLAGLVIVLWVARRVRRSRRVVPCPHHGESARIVLITDAATGDPIGIDVCSLVEGPLTCDRSCMAAAAQGRPVTLGVQKAR
jgi:hypothetical protein